MKNVTVQPANKDSKRIRKKQEIIAMNEQIYTAVESCLATRALAWASGEISDSEFFTSLKKTADEQGKTYFPPTQGFDSLS